jgi:DNA-binding phage protein
MSEATPDQVRKPRTTPYDVAEHLRTPEERAAYLEAWLTEAPEDTEGMARAVGDATRAGFQPGSSFQPE